MMLLRIGAGFGNYFFTFFIYREVAKQYGQDIELLEEYSSNKGNYTNVLDELNAPTYTKWLLEYSDDGKIRWIFDIKIIDLIKKYKVNSRVTCIGMNDLMFMSNGEIKVKDESVFEKYDIIACDYTDFYNDGIREWLIGHKSVLHGAFNISDKYDFIDTSNSFFITSSIGVHIRIYKLQRYFTLNEISRLFTSMLEGIERIYPNNPVVLFTDNMEITRSVLNTKFNNVYFIDIPISAPLKDLYELIELSKCKYVIKFEMSSYNFWAEMISKQKQKQYKIDFDLDGFFIKIWSVGNMIDRYTSMNVSPMFTKIADRMRQNKYHRGKVIKIIDFEVSKLMKTLEDEKLYEIYSSNQPFSKTIEIPKIYHRISEISNIKYQEYAKSEYKKKNYCGCVDILRDVIYQIDDVSIHEMFLDALIQSGCKTDAFVEKLYLFFIFHKEEKNFDDYKEQKCYSKLCHAKIPQIYAYVSIERELFSCVTSYIEDICIIFSKMGLRTTLLVKEENAYRNRYNSNMIDYMRESWKKYNLQIESAENHEYLKDNLINSVLLVRKCDLNWDFINKYNIGCSVIFDSFKWYDDFETDCGDPIVESMNTDMRALCKHSILVTSKSEDYRDSLFEHIINCAQSPVFNIVEERMTTFKARQMDESLLRLACECLSDVLLK